MPKAMKQGTPSSLSFVEPMKALPVQKLPEGDWLYEVKLDGYRALAFKEGKEVRLISRNQKPLMVMRSREWNQGQNGPPAPRIKPTHYRVLTQIDLSRF
jgi:hypothetical protein